MKFTIKPEDFEHSKPLKPMSLREIFDAMVTMFKPELTDKEKEAEYQRILKDIENNKENGK